MRPKLIALIAVTGFALTGCSTNSPNVEPATTSVAPAATEPSQEVATQEVPSESVEAVEEQFADFAEDRASHLPIKKMSRTKVIDGLHTFCEDGKAFKVSTSDEFNVSLGKIAEANYCERLEAN